MLKLETDRDHWSYKCGKCRTENAEFTAAAGKAWRKAHAKDCDGAVVVARITTERLF